MRPPFGPRGPLPPFDPREGDAFFRLPFDDVRGPPGVGPPLMRPPFPPLPGPPMGAGNAAEPPPWRNQENGPPPGSSSWSMDSGNGHDSDEHSQQREGNNHVGRDSNQKNIHKSQDSKASSNAERLERDNRNRNRKSRWANVSPPPADHIDITMSENDAEDDTKMQMDTSTDEANDNDITPPGESDLRENVAERTEDRSITENPPIDHSYEGKSPQNEINHHNEDVETTATKPIASPPVAVNTEENCDYEEKRTFDQTPEESFTQVREQEHPVEKDDSPRRNLVEETEQHRPVVEDRTREENICENVDKTMIDSHSDETTLEPTATSDSNVLQSNNEDKCEPTVPEERPDCREETADETVQESSSL